MIEKSISKTLIELRDITHDFRGINNKVKRLLKSVSWQLKQGQRVGVISKSMQEAHAFLDCAAGIATPQQGDVSIQANVSWPLGSKGGLPNSLSGRQNAKFLQGVYGLGGQERQDLDQILSLADLEEGFFDKPLKSYNKFMRARFNLAVAMVFDFDVYVVPKQFAWKSNATSERMLRLQRALKERTAGKSILMTNTDFNFLEQFCTEGLVLNQGSIAFSGSFAECRSWYDANISKAPEDDLEQELDSEEGIQTTDQEQDILDDELW